MADKTETIVLVMDREQTELQIQQLQNALGAGGESILMITTNNRRAERQLRRACEGGTFDDLPDPDVVVFSTIFTVALPVEPDDLSKIASDWSKS